MRVLSLSFAMTLLFAGCGDDDVPHDAGVGDSAADIGPRCVEDAECDDGLFCTGEESCAEGICVPGTAIQCDDEIDCTIDACNEVTNRCEGLAPDLDEDGAGDMSCVDASGEPLGRDCDDQDPGRFGGNREICDAENVDEDCDGDTFGQIDSDGDGYFDQRCQNTAADGSVHRGDDCDDGRQDVNPATTEVCDHIDNNCDGNTDEGVTVLVAPDADRDGFPVNMPLMECPGFAGLVAIDDATVFDCDDSNLARNPGQVEVCDALDNDCDDAIDEGAVAVDWYHDDDGDGFGSASSGVTRSCDPVPNASLLDTDCDDTRAALNPAAAERCNALDDDCNGLADYEVDGNYEDDDGDGSADIICGAPFGVDCDDQDASTAGGSPEVCDGRDNDCDGRVDENVEALQWFYDGDRDGHGTLSDAAHAPVIACAPPPGYVGSGGDCDDHNPARFPGAAETCGHIDDDCDGAIDEGLSTCPCPGGFVTCPLAPAPGCQTNIWGDPLNCGGCGDVCGGPHVELAFCNRGTCVANDCESGYNDCNMDMQVLNGDGCETLGLCPPTGVERILPLTTLPLAGPPGGDLFVDRCETGALVGVEGSTVGWLGRISAVCARLRITTTVGAHSIVRDGMVTLPRRGLRTMTPFSAVCPANEVVVGFGGRSGALIDQLVIHCAPLLIQETGSAFEIRVGTPHALPTVGSSGGDLFPDRSCADGELAQGAYVHAGDSVDGFSIMCGRLGLTYVPGT